GSDPDASLYWLARMLEGGEDPNFLARRLVRMAVEDIGLADPEALTITLSAWQVYERLGSPEGELALAEATLYLALAPKSNAAYTAFKRAQKLASDTSHQDPPKTILNAPTKLMKKLDYGKNYAYDHDTPDGFSGQNYFPEEIKRPSFYKPVKRGFEREMEKRIAYFNSLRAKLNPSK
ncbi:MAG: replication-associated recombination protein A, partial [Bdellovibrionales bacterium]|nr:replication-associated recombination protein A [Bdellovibrionales bacterium]